MNTLARKAPLGRMRLTLVRFPGSNCDADCVDGLGRHFGITVQTVWHDATALPASDVVVLPGGFSFGDYLRSGALAAQAPIMAAVRSFVARGGAVFGICNGFQVLTESRILPGALLRNAGRRFVCQMVALAPAPGPLPMQRALTLGGAGLRVPIAHGEGRYYIDAEGLARLRAEGLVAFRYAHGDGTMAASANPNGSVDAIAGVFSANGRVLGMMPHPERAMDPLVGGSRDGLAIFEAFLAAAL